MRYKIGFTPNVTLGPFQNGVKGTHYIYDTKNDCERMCYATTREYAEQIRATLEFMDRHQARMGSAVR